MCTQFMLFGFAFAYRMDQLCILSRIRSEAELAGQVICIKGSKLLRRNGGKCRKEVQVELLGQFIKGIVIKGSKLLSEKG